MVVHADDVIWRTCVSVHDNPHCPAPVSADGTAGDLETRLGDPMDEAAGPFSYKAIVEAEERDQLPPKTIETARALGVPAYLVPDHLGGGLTDLEQVLVTTRILARRNLAVALMYGSTLLGALPVWLWGTAGQQRLVADTILNGELAGFAASEADGGSDILSNQSQADCQDGIVVLTGTKWPAGNATRSRLMSVMARTGPSSCSFLLVDKARLDPDSWTALPPIKTVGLRGHDLSGIRFQDARLPGDCVIGQRNAGFGQFLKTLQLTRTAVGAMSLGTMDALLRVGSAYAHQRVLYGAPIYHLPAVRDHLVKASLDLLIAECVTFPVARSLSFAPLRLSLWSSVVKCLVPFLGERVVDDIGALLAARGYMREGVAHGIFQKLQRDHASTTIFEGTTHVNLGLIAAQLPLLTKPPAATRTQDPLLAALFDRTVRPPLWRPDGQALGFSCQRRDEITQQLTTTISQLLAAAHQHALPPVTDRLRQLLPRITALYVRLQADVTAAGADTNSVAALERARRHCDLHAMASCMLTYLHNHTHLGGAFTDGGWLVLCLQRLLQRTHPDTTLDAEYLPALEEALADQAGRHRWFSLLSLAAAPR
jgi:alkylation response protein AidB-like acyl-CoA dehydrogenase